MARVINSVTWRDRGPLPKQLKYPWDEWCDGKIRILEHTVDFDCAATAIGSQFAARCRERGRFGRSSVYRPGDKMQIDGQEITVGDYAVVILHAFREMNDQEKADYAAKAEADRIRSREYNRKYQHKKTADKGGTTTAALDRVLSK